MDNSFYTYAYLREDGTPYYIGKGKRNRAFKTSGRKVSVPPLNRILFLKKGLTEEEAFKHEVYMIALYGREDGGEGILLNFTDGGEGCSGRSVSKEVREKISRFRKGKKLSEETRKKISVSAVGRKVSEEVKSKIKNKLKGRRLSAETVSRMNTFRAGEKNPQSLLWRIEFEDGRVIEQWGLTNWAKENGYNANYVGAMASGKRNKHKDIVKVEKVEVKK